MSSIRIWIGPEGKWSEEFLGIDKVHFIKQAILFGCRKCYYDEDWCDDEDWCELLKGLEINAQEIEASNRVYRKGDDDTRTESVSWPLFEKDNNISIASTKILKLPLSIFEEMANEEKERGQLFTIYTTMDEAAKSPKPVPEGYSLLFKFADE